jgi:hypothetical protein
MSRLREKTTATLLIAIFMISTLSVMSIGAPADGYSEAVLNAADRLVEQQNTGDGYDPSYIGGFRMWIDETPPGTYLRTHNIGVTAIGILKAHELLDKPEYETALAMAYKFVVDHEPVWIGYPVSDPTYWKESPGGVNSWPDIHFLIDLAEAAASDTSLLTAINNLIEPDITADDIVELAKDRWDDRLNHAGAVYPSEIGTATGMAEWLIGVRLGTWESLIPWDLEAAVKSAVALHEKYPEYGYLKQAQDIAEVIYDCIYGDPSYLDINDPTEKCYTLGLAGAIEAFTEAGLYPDEARDLKDLLIGYQSVNGYWDASDLSDQESVQSTAYAVLALLAQGDADAQKAAVKGGKWLVDTQDELGGWDPSSLGSGDENLECDGEAAWALSGLTKSTHEYICVWWLEDAERYGGDGTPLGSWTDDRIPPASPVGYVEFKITGRAYHGGMEWFYNYYPLEDFEASPLVITNGKFSAWARYTSPRSGLPILDKIRGKLTIGGGTACGSYTQYGYAFGDESTIKSWYPNAVATDEIDMWHIGTTYYTVHGQTPTI